MTQFLVQFSPCRSPAPCAACAGVCDPGTTVCLVLADGRPVCARCGKAHAPALAALVRLADEAARVGRISRHNIPPYTALLELARVADAYASLVPERAD